MSFEHFVVYLFLSIVALCDATSVISIGIAFFDHLPVLRFSLVCHTPLLFHSNSFKKEATDFSVTPYFIIWLSLNRVTQHHSSR